MFEPGQIWKHKEDGHKVRIVAFYGEPWNFVDFRPLIATGIAMYVPVVGLPQERFKELYERVIDDA